MMTDQPEYSRYSILHSNDDPRAFVIKLAVNLEEAISISLAWVLNIDDWENSTSLGYGRQSLGFIKKINILTDKKELSKEDKIKLELIAGIRNKFAHIKKVDKFQSLFEINKDFKIKLDNLYSTKFDNITESEEKYKFSYFLLFKDSFDIIFNITINTVVYETEHKEKTKFLKDFYNRFKVEADNSKKANEIMKKIGKEIFENKND